MTLFLRTTPQIDAPKNRRRIIALNRDQVRQNPHRNQQKLAQLAENHTLYFPWPNCGARDCQLEETANPSPTFVDYCCCAIP